MRKDEGQLLSSVFLFSALPSTFKKAKMKRLRATFPTVIGALLIVGVTVRVITDDASQMLAAGPAWCSPGLKLRQHNR